MQFVLTGCKPTAELLAANPQPAMATTEVILTPSPTALPPTAVIPPTAVPTAAPPEQSSFALVVVEPSATPVPITPTATANGATATVAPTEEPSPTPPPTFTPPALPFTSPNEHYWLRRPIAEGGTVWTDKSYPYGGTRNGTLRPHHGVEFYVSHGTEVLSAASGTVVMAGSDDEIVSGPHTNFYGNVIVIELDTAFLDQPVYNLYGHLSEIFVAVGQHVDAQEIIALSGATGVADGPHLHFEVRLGANDYSQTRSPLLWLYPFPDHGTLAGRVIWPNGELAHGANIFLRRIDAASKYAETTSYANVDEELNGDDGWEENFAFDDVVAGYYEVEVRSRGKKFKEEVWIYPYRTSFVEITIGE